MTSYPLSLPRSSPLITLTHPEPAIWIIELHNGQDSRLTETLVDEGMKPALDIVESDWSASLAKSKGNPESKDGAGALIIVGRRDQDKFFSNGLDYASAIKNRMFFPDVFNPLLARLLTFPIPTIAAINGHCFAGGMMLSLACDFRVMTDGSSRNTWMCMNEVHFGAIWPQSFATILRSKFGSGALQRKIALEGHRFTPQEALEAGLVDHIVKGKTEDVIQKAKGVAKTVAGNAKAGVWGAIKEDLYRDTLRNINDRTPPTAKSRL